MEWMLLPYKKLYRLIEGRSSRREYWMFTLFNMLVLIGVMVLFFIFAGGIASAFGALDPENLGGVAAGAGIVMIILFVVVYVWAILTGVAMTAVSIRRLHDQGLSGWVYVAMTVASFIPILGILVGIAFIVLMVRPGTQGPNSYGEDPYREREPDVFS